MSIQFVDSNYLASGQDILDANYIAKESFSATCPPREISKWTDANGGVHPTYYPLRILTVEFITASMTDAMLDDFRKWFTDHFSGGTRMLSITAWCADEGKYITQDCDLVEFAPVHDRRISARDGNAYQAFNVKLQGRGGTI